MATMMSAIVPIGSPDGSRTGRPMHWLRKRIGGHLGRRAGPTRTGGRPVRETGSRQRAGRTLAVPADRPAELGPVSTGGGILVRRGTPRTGEPVSGGNPTV